MDCIICSYYNNMRLQCDWFLYVYFTGIIIVNVFSGLQLCVLNSGCDLDWPGGLVWEVVGEADWKPVSELNNVSSDQLLAAAAWEPSTHFLAVLELDDGSAVLEQSKGCSVVFLK